MVLSKMKMVVVLGLVSMLAPALAQAESMNVPLAPLEQEGPVNEADPNYVLPGNPEPQFVGADQPVEGLSDDVLVAGGDDLKAIRDKIHGKTPEAATLAPDAAGTWLLYSKRATDPGQESKLKNFLSKMKATGQLKGTPGNQ